MKIRAIVYLVSLVSCGQGFAQDSTSHRVWPVSISLFNNQTSLPVGMKLGMTKAPVHPGLSIGTWYTWNENSGHAWKQTVVLGAYYHQYSQTGIQLYSELQYQFKKIKRVYPEAGFGAGYLHAISNLEQFKLSSNGTYEKKVNLGRPQCMISVHTGLFIPVRKKVYSPAANCSACRTGAGAPRVSGIFIRYQLWMQTPFVKNYVPLLPNTSLHIGYSTFITCKKKGGRK